MRPLYASSFLRLVIAVLAAGLLAACGSRSGDDNPVTFMVSGDPSQLAAYETLVAGFTELNPDIEVRLIYLAGEGEYRERLSTMFSGQVPPDVFLYNFRRLGNYAESGAIHPLGDLLDASDVIERADYFEIPMDAFVYNGELTCIPQNLSSPVIYYNKAHFDAAGLAYPDDDWSLDEFLAIAIALTQDTDGDGAADQWGFGSEVATIRLAPFIWTNGGDFFDDLHSPTKLTLDEPATREAIQWFVDLQLVHGVAPDIISETAQSSEDRFLNGSLSMYMNSRVVVPALRTITAFEWDAAALPLGGQGISVLHSDGFCMSARAADDEAHAAAVWAFIEYALSEQGQVILSETGRTVPSMVRVAESSVFLDSAPPANNQIWLDAPLSMRAFPMRVGWNTFEELLSRELQRAFYGDVTLDEFFTNAEKLAEPLISE